MDLYDDLDTKQRPGQIDGWSSGVKLLQSQLALKKTLPTPTQRKDFAKRSTVLAPVMLLKSKNNLSTVGGVGGSDHGAGDDIFKSDQPTGQHQHHRSKQLQANHFTTTTTSVPQHVLTVTPSSKVFNDYDWDVVDEYDPLWPNEYEKLVKDRRDKEGDSKHHRGGGTGGGGHHRGDGDRMMSYNDRKRRGAGNRFEPDGSSGTPKQFSGFGGRPDDEDSYARSPPTAGGLGPRNAGAAIAPPPSLQESTPIIPAFAAGAAAAAGKAGNFGASTVAAKIMAKYGFRDGQGLGKQEQGMSMALQVEKTSKRGGRIIHERESIGGTSPGRPEGSASPPLAGATSAAAIGSPAPAAALAAGPQLMLPPSMVPAAVANSKATTATTSAAGGAALPAAEEPTITEIMKAPSKVVLLRNMVGPGDVDNDLEPEVKDECNTKYGEVVSVVINELQNVVAEEAVRIFVEFKRIESAIKGER